MGLLGPVAADAEAAPRGALNDPPPAFAFAFACPVTVAEPPTVRPTTPDVRDADSVLAHCARRASSASESFL